MAFLKLPNPGDHVIMTIHQAEVDTSGDFPAILFDGDEGSISVPQTTAEAQLGRCGLSVATCLGQTLQISRSLKVGKNGKPFWNIERATALGQGQPPAATARPKAPGPDAAWATLQDTYLACCRIAGKTIGKLPGATAGDVAASAATLFIQAGKLGLVAKATAVKAAPPAPPAPPTVESYAEVPPALEPDDDGSLPF